jgi:Na+/proline symporter
MQNQVYFLSQDLALLLIVAVSLIFAVIGILYSRKHQGLSNYLTAGRNVGTLSLTTSLVASALGS